MQLRIGVTPRDIRVTFPQLVALGIAQEDGPVERSRATFNDVEVSAEVFWRKWETSTPHAAGIRWTYDDDRECWGKLSWDGDCAKVQNTSFDFTPAELLGTLKRVDFTVSNVYRAYFKWWTKPRMYRPPGMSDGHFSNGSFAAFSKQDGHARLVSRRWLTHGPWRLIRDESTDLTLVQYHDLEAEEGDALEQAYDGHQAMGIEDHGGFIQTDFPFGHALKPSFYDRASNTSIVLVPASQPVSHQQMLEAAALKLWQPHAEHPIAQVAFVFTDEANARKHLHDLWLRGLEVRVVDRRIDEAYDPGPPPVLDWVKRVQDREGF
jgi:hypothetical protein